ncbi:uncharacterized protein LOC142297392 [Anomaloglossus baeobatrachus]|uniref:uncharacterized protein LOC142297392 n=1 Tax=Anomaloglossus baeobatrachus TaxID=238106 RepID=UPI003F4FEB76
MLPLDPVTVLLSIVTCIFLATVMYKQKGRVHPNYPPGPKPWPIIGNIPILNVQKPYLSFQELAKKYGQVYSIRIGAQEMVVLSGYDIVKEALVNKAEEFSERPNVPIFMDFSKGHGIVFSNGHSWKAMRWFTLSTLRDFGMGTRTIEDKINEETNHLITIFKSYKGEPFTNTMIMNTAVCNIIVSILFGHRFEYDDQKLHKLLKIVMEVAKNTGSPMALLYNAFPSLMRWIPGTHKSVQQNVDELHSFIREIFTRQRNKLDVNDQSSLIDYFLIKQKEYSQYINSMFSKFQEKPNPELYFHDENLTSLVADLFAAGMETTSTTLKWGLLIMMKYPEIQTNVQKEIEKVIGSAEPQMAHHKEMPYTDAVIHEVQRFANLVPTNVPHQTTQDVTLRGFFLPKGTHVIPSLTSVLRDDKYFKKPDDFYPEHFLDSDGNFVKNEAFLPFSAGKRSCAGENLAKMELFLFFTKLLQNFTFKAPPGAKLDLTAEIGFTLRPQEHDICAISRYFSRIVIAALGIKQTLSQVESNSSIQLTGDPGGCSEVPPNKKRRIQIQTAITDSDSSEEMLPLDPVTVLLCVVACIFLANVTCKQKERVHPNYPPGPKPWPIIGNIPILNVQKPYLTFQELAKTYGPVYSLKIGAQEMVVLSGYDVVKEALVTQAEMFSDRPAVPVFMDVTKGHGIVFSNGHSWKAMRRFTLSTLRDFGMGTRTLEDKINEETDYLLKIFKSYKGEPFDNTIIMNTAVCNIIVSILFGHRFDYDDPQLHRLLRIVMDTVRIAGSPMALLYNAFPSLMRWIPGTHKSITQKIFELHTFFKGIFAKQRKELDINNQRSLVDYFLVKQKEEKPNPELYFHDKNLTSLVTDLFAAGMETTSTTLRWGLLIMMKYPEIQKNVQKEIEKVIGLTEPQMTHRKQMPYTDAVIHEIQRFANLLPTNVPHQTTQDVTLKGFFLPKGTHVIPSLTSVLRDEKYFKKPDEFYPQHFLDSDGNFVKNEAFLPFSAGKRSCAGENLAKMELFLFFTKLLQNFTFQAPPGAKLDLSCPVGFTSRPQDHEICAIPRY